MARARLVEDRLQELGALYQMARFAGRTFFEEFCRYPSSLSYPPLAVTPRCIAGMMRLIGGHRDSRSVGECVGQALARHRFRVPEGAHRPERTLSAQESGVAGAGLRRTHLPRALHDAVAWLRTQRLFTSLQNLEPLWPSSLCGANTYTSPCHHKLTGCVSARRACEQCGAGSKRDFDSAVPLLLSWPFSQKDSPNLMTPSPLQKTRHLHTPPAQAPFPVRVIRHENARCLDDPAHPRLDLGRLFRSNRLIHKKPFFS